MHLKGGRAVVGGKDFEVESLYNAVEELGYSARLDEGAAEIEDEDD